MSKHNDAQAMVHELMARLLRNSGAILSFRRVVTTGLPTIARQMAAEDAAFLRAIAPEVMIGDVASFVAGSGPETLAGGMAHQATMSAAQVANAAALVFAHAVMDDAALTCCEITTLLAPEEWGEDLAATKVALGDARREPDQLLPTAIKRRLEELKRASLPEKLDIVFRRCRPKPGAAQFTDGTKYDPTRVAGLDDLRHSVVHNLAIRIDLPTFEDDLWFLVRLPFLILNVVCARYGLVMNAEEVKRVLGREGGRA